MQDVRLFLQFAAVAETLSFSEAGRRLGVAQPWLSARIRKLEDRLGVPLFTRTSRRVELTPHGRRLYELALPLARAADQLDNQLASWRDEVVERVRIGCPQLGEPDRQQADLLAHFMATNPKIEVDMEPGWSDRHAELLERGNLDLMLAVYGTPPPNVEFVRLHRLTFAIMMHEHDPLAEQENLTVAMLAGRRLALGPPHRMGQLHGLLYTPFVDAGVIPVTVPELRRSLLQKAPDLIVSTIVTMPGEARLRYGVVRRVLADIAPLWLMLLRPAKGFSSKAAERFWQAAQDFTGNSVDT